MVNFCCPWIVMYRKAVLWIIVIEFYALHETWTANLILYTVHVHWGQIEEIKSFSWLNDLNHHLEAWFNFTFEVFDVTSHFSVLRPKHVAEIKYTICFVTLEMQKCCSWTCDETTFAPLDTVYIPSKDSGVCWTSKSCHMCQSHQWVFTNCRSKDNII